jgi:hypothetical protein
MLAEGVEVWNLDGDIDWFIATDRHRICTKAAHKALLINIEPIVKETAEDILRELVGCVDSDLYPHIVKRAKALLEDK